jgi:hypothetical protein
LRTSRLTLSLLGLLLETAAAGGCGSSSSATAEAGADGASGTDSSETSPEGGAPDGAGGPADAQRDVVSEANACLLDVSTTVCCCEGDIGATVVCNADGTIGCYDPVFPGTPFRVYYGDDCTRPCGPCSIACPIDSGGDTGGGTSDAAPTSDAGSYGCSALPASDSMCTSPPHFYRCVTPYKAPSGCTVLSIANVTDLYCCP